MVAEAVPLRGSCPWCQELVMSDDQAQPEYLKAEYVGQLMASEGRANLSMSVGRAAGSALLAGAFVTFGALLSILVPAGVETEGVTLLLQGLAFAVGYYFVALAGVALFTEANVSLPNVLLDRSKSHLHLARFWALTFAFNFLGAFTVGWMIHLAQNYSPEVTTLLDEVVALKMSYMERGGGAWLAIVLSAVLANWMVGLAFFFATMAQKVWSKFVPLALAVLLFEAANFQHSPANMAYFSLIMPGGGGPGWTDAIWWNTLPAAIGNIVGGALLVAVPFWYVCQSRSRAEQAGHSSSGSAS
jgi:formate/nitrite transporter FocA (FNT family)